VFSGDCHERQMRINRWTLLLTGLVVLVAGFLLFRSDPDEQRHTGPAPETARQDTEIPAPPEADGPPDEAAPSEPVPDTGLVRPELELDGDAEPVVLVDSFSPSEQMPLTTWSMVQTSVGHFDVLRIANLPAGGGPVPANTLMAAHGWAGDPGLGLRISDVLLARCNRIVARAQVTVDRSDVAEGVHPNLLRSGWAAQIYAGDLPSCADNRISAWAVIPGVPARLAPLIGSHSVEVEPDGDSTRRRVSAQINLDPYNYPPPPLRSIELRASRANMRRCGSTACPVVAQVDSGIREGQILERHDEWSLVSIEGRAGWIFNELYRVGE